jgi:Ca2+-binding EF-hand superfamily protein
MESLRNSCKEAKMNLSDRELKDMIDIADKNGDSLINKTEFMEIMLKTNLYSP